ncbi:MAG TPA: glycosyltransferase, partial [Solirubrobacteraceae bacterium]|nr:glycosyltransferase [Solirubrobacteraceae bacterium]
GGRNAAAALATGDALLFLDDDAILRPGALDAAVRVLEAEPGVGAVAFRIVDPQTRRTALWLYPLDVHTWEGRRFDVPTFVGCGGLVRRAVFEGLGGFWEGYHREVEELDLCWRMLGAGWRIRYEPDAVVEHPERVARRLYRYAVPANVVLPYRLLPPGLAARQAAVKVPLFALRSLRYREVGDFAGGLRLLPAMLRRARRERAPLDARTVAFLRALHAQEGWRGRVQWALRRRPLPELHPSP